jgi:hypothetical protein
MILSAFIIYKFGYIENFDLNQIKSYLINISNFNSIEENPIETYDKSFFNFKKILSYPYKTFFEDTHYSTYILTITYFIIFLPSILTLSYLWGKIFKECKFIKYYILNILLLMSSIMPFIIGAFFLGFVDHYRFFSSVILLNFICFLFSYKRIKNKLIFGKKEYYFINIFFIISLFYNITLNTFFAPLEKNALLFSKAIYYLF